MKKDTSVNLKKLNETRIQQREAAINDLDLLVQWSSLTASPLLQEIKNVRNLADAFVG